jgi:hypothetical protein
VDDRGRPHAAERAPDAGDADDLAHRGTHLTLRGSWLIVLAAACGGGSGSEARGDAGHDGSTGETDSAGDSTRPERPDATVPSVDATASGDDATTPSGSDGAPSNASSDAAPDDPSDGSSEGAATCVMAFPAVTDFGSKGPFDVSIDCSVPTTVTGDGKGCAIYHPTTMTRARTCERGPPLVRDLGADEAVNYT